MDKSMFTLELQKKEKKHFIFLPNLAEYWWDMDSRDHFQSFGSLSLKT